MTASEHHRLKWQCRRGLLELDLILERFLLKNSNLEEKEITRLLALLDLPDNELWDIVNGRSDRFDERHRETVARLRAA